jgi:hypothetical protein
MALRLVRGIATETEKPKQKSREEYLLACLREEVSDPKFTEWEQDFIVSLARQVQQGKKLSVKQKGILERIWKK